MVFGIALIFCTGLRSFQWNDTSVYAQSFQYYTNDLFDYSISDMGNGYSDKGFYFLSSVIKTFTSSYTIYFLIIAALTFYFLVSSLRTYCIYPLIGLCVYISRFILTRNMMQIRAALAIAVVVWALRYIDEKKLKKFLFTIVIAMSLHMSAVIALPLYWLNKIKITPMFILCGIIGAFVCIMGGTSLIMNKVQEISMMYNVATSYTSENSSYTMGMGVSNPMIYYQTLLLLLFTFLSERLSKVVPHYTVVRDGYFYSTVLLIILSPFGVLSGRASTIYATFEIFIIPSLIFAFSPKYRFMGFMGVGVILSVLFYMNYISVVSNF
ncbi:EpsG family protein [uncultured Bacteroides sp.]|nr:EpsG family protein [uncultured Bacteroides sp.]